MEKVGKVFINKKDFIMRDISEEMENFKNIDKNFKISQIRVIAFEESDILYAYSNTDKLKKANIFKSIDMSKINFIRKESKNNVSEAKQKDVEMLLNKNGI